MDSDCKSLYGLSLQPYWVVASVCASKVLVIEIISRILKCIQNRGDKQQAEPSDYQRMEDSQIAENRDYHPHLIVCWVESLWCVVQFIYICLSFDSVDSHWQRYQELYVRFLSAGAAGIVVIWFTYFSDDGFSARDGRWSYWVHSIYVVLGPPMITHFIPMLFAYIWICLGVVLMTFLLYKFYMWIEHRCGPTSQSYSRVLFIKFFFIFWCMVVCQTLMHYGVLLYGGQSYIDVITTEYQMRDATCYWESLQHLHAKAIMGVVGAAS